MYRDESHPSISISIHSTHLNIWTHIHRMYIANQTLFIGLYKSRFLLFSIEIGRNMIPECIKYMKIIYYTVNAIIKMEVHFNQPRITYIRLIQRLQVVNWLSAVIWLWFTYRGYRCILSNITGCSILNYAEANKK